MTDIDLTGSRPTRVVAVEEHFIDPEVNARYDEIFEAADHTLAERGKAAFITQFISQGEIMDLADYLHERFWYTPSGMYDERTARFCVEEFGADHVMWATDYPYRHPGDAKEFIGRLGLTEEEAEKVGHLNAERLFRLV